MVGPSRAVLQASYGAATNAVRTFSHVSATRDFGVLLYAIAFC